MPDFLKIIEKNQDLNAIIFQSQTGKIIQIHEGQPSKNTKNSFQNLLHQTIQQVFKNFINEREQKQLEDWLQLIGDELYVNLMTEEDLMKLCPVISLKWYDEQIYQISFKPIHGKNAFEHVVALLTPYIEQSERKQVQEIMQLIQELQKMDAEQIRNLLEYLPALQEKLASSPSQNISHNEFLNLKKNLHIIKGSFFFYKLNSLGNACHYIESQLQELNPESFDTIQNMISPLLMLLDLAEGFCANLQHSSIYQRNEVVPIPTQIYYQMIQQSEKLYQNLLSQRSTNPTTFLHIQQLRNSLITNGMVSLNELVERLDFLKEQLALELQKEVKIVKQLTDEQIYLPQVVFYKLWNALSQLLKNAIDHGIESSDERQKSHKPSVAIIEFQVTQMEGHLKISFKDDGKGLDLDLLIQKAQQQNQLSKEELLILASGEKEAMNLIFSAGISTRNKISVISGRGMGMSIVNKEVESCFGEVSVDSKAGEFCHFVITIPIEKNHIMSFSQDF